MVRKGIYTLAVMLIIGLPLVLPLRIESSIFIFLAGLSAVSYALVFVLFRLIKRMLGGAATFGYSPTAVYMTGNKAIRVRKNRLPGMEEADMKGNAGPSETGQGENITTTAGRGDKNVHS